MGEALLMRRGGVDTDNVTAASKDVLSGKIIVNADGEEVEGSLAPKFPNLLSDGSFETAAGDITKSAWQFGGRNTKDFSSICMNGAKSLSMYWSDGSPDYSMAYQYVNMVKNHKYYVSGWFLRSGDLTHDVNYIDIYGSVSGMAFFSITNKTVPEINTWTHLSNIMSANAGGENMLRLIVCSRVNILCDAFSLIDLTEVFGSGNEPTKEEMDAIFRRIEWAGDNLPKLVSDATIDSSKILSGYVGYGAEGKRYNGSIQITNPDTDDQVKAASCSVGAYSSSEPTVENVYFNIGNLNYSYLNGVTYVRYPKADIMNIIGALQKKTLILKMTPDSYDGATYAAKDGSSVYLYTRNISAFLTGYKYIESIKASYEISDEEFYTQITIGSFTRYYRYYHGDLFWDRPYEVNIGETEVVFPGNNTTREVTVTVDYYV